MFSANFSASRAQKLNGMTTRERGEEKVRQALSWVYRWGWSSPKTLDSLAGAKRRGLSKRLVQRGLLRATKTEAGGGWKGQPAVILTLTRAGLLEVEKNLSESEFIDYTLDPYRVRQATLRHDELAQSSTAKLLNDGLITGFLTPRELASRSEKGVKQPDSAWTLATGERAMVEIELSAKWERDLDQFITGCIKALEDRYDALVIVTDAEPIYKRYSRAFEPGAKVGVWQKNARDEWVKTGTTEVPGWVEGKIIWQLLSNAQQRNGAGE